MNSITTQVHTAEDKRLAVALLVLTFSTGLIDAVSFVGLGKVFTANMTGNVVFLGFAIAGVAGLSFWRSVASSRRHVRSFSLPLYSHGPSSLRSVPVTAHKHSLSPLNIAA